MLLTFDRDGSGTLTFDELIQATATHGARSRLAGAHPRAVCARRATHRRPARERRLRRLRLCLGLGNTALAAVSASRGSLPSI